MPDLEPDRTKEPDRSYPDQLRRWVEKIIDRKLEEFRKNLKDKD